jgi:hypothetical protein
VSRWTDKTNVIVDKQDNHSGQTRQVSQRTDKTSATAGSKNKCTADRQHNRHSGQTTQMSQRTNEHLRQSSNRHIGHANSAGKRKRQMSQWILELHSGQTNIKHKSEHRNIVTGKKPQRTSSQASNTTDRDTSSQASVTAVIVKCKHPRKRQMSQTNVIGKCHRQMSQAGRTVVTSRRHKQSSQARVVEYSEPWEHAIMTADSKSSSHNKSYMRSLNFNTQRCTCRPLQQAGALIWCWMWGSQSVSHDSAADRELRCHPSSQT